MTCDDDRGIRFRWSQVIQLKLPDILFCSSACPLLPSYFWAYDATANQNESETNQHRYISNGKRKHYNTGIRIT